MFNRGTLFVLVLGAALVVPYVLFDEGLSKTARSEWQRYFGSRGVDAGATSGGLGSWFQASGQPPLAHLDVGPQLMGRVLDAMGQPIDDLRSPVTTETLPLEGASRSPLDRVPIKQPLGTGIRVLDALLTVGRGQRVGIFGGSGVGKSTLIGMMTRNTEADVTVVGLVGERGREVREFLEDDLGEAGLARSIVVVSTSDEPAMMRLRAAFVATRIAEPTNPNQNGAVMPNCRASSPPIGVPMTMPPTMASR